MKLAQVLPDDSEVRVVLETGFALCQAGRLAEAEDVFRGVAEMLPSSAVPQVALGQVFLQRGLYREAQLACEEALRRQPESSYALVHRAEALLFQQRREEAELELNDVLTRDPSSPHSRTARALLDAANLICGLA